MDSAGQQEPIREDRPEDTNQHEAQIIHVEHLAGEGRGWQPN